MNVVKALPKNEAKAETKPGVKTVKPTENLQNATETKPTEEEAKQEVKALLEPFLEGLEFVARVKVAKAKLKDVK